MTRNNNEITITEEESRTCKLCNATFDSSKTMMWHHIRKLHHLTCEQYILKAYYDDIRPVCLKTGNFLPFRKNKLGPFFSNYSTNNFPRKPHTEETKLKIKQGCEDNAMKKFGVKNVFTTEWCKEKSKETILQKYGVENIMQLDEMREKAKLQLNSAEALEKRRIINEKAKEDNKL